uniref:Large ribosomal subunit protein uL15 n=1 Tax=candidate division WOR-3 bacterium TaxID=2052148 RepID=A0A7V4E4C5_UNCW3
MKIADLKPPKGAKKRKKRVGCGPGSGHGKTACRGTKGAKQRSGKEYGPGFEGGQMPLIRRIPKRGFHNPFKKEYAVVNLKKLEKIIEKYNEITPEILKKEGIVKKDLPIKILGDGELKKPIKIIAHAFSEKAKEKITAIGGSFEIINK